MKTLAAVVVMAALVPSAARAQEAPVLQIRSAFGASHYLHADLDYTAPTLLVSVRAGWGAFAVEPEFAASWHEQTQTFNVNSSATTDVRFQSAGVNIVVRGTGRVSAYGGGGVGFYWERRRYRVDDPVFGYEQSGIRGPRLGAQALAGVDVPVASRIKAFGQFRYEMRSFQDPGGGSVVQFLGGVSIDVF